MHGDSGATVFKQVACKSINKIRSYSIQIMLGGGKGGKGPWGDAWGRGKGGRRTEGRTLVHRARQSYHTAPKAIGKSRTTKDPHFCAPSTCTTKARSSIMGRVHQDLCHSWRNGIGEGVWTGVRRSQLLDDKRETTSARARTTPHRHLSQTICLSEAAQPCPPVSPGEFVPLGVRLTALSLAEAVGGCTGAGCNVTEGTVGGDRGDEVAGGAADTPRSFCAMFGTSRGADVQYYKSRSCQSVELCSKYERSSSKMQHKANGVKRWRRVRRCPMRQCVLHYERGRTTCDGLKALASTTSTSILSRSPRCCAANGPRARKQGTKKAKEARKGTNLWKRFPEPLLLDIPCMAA